VLTFECEGADLVFVICQSKRMNKNKKTNREFTYLLEIVMNFLDTNGISSLLVNPSSN
jgi:hypothetical protein